jgi:hypothetical protein
VAALDVVGSLTNVKTMLSGLTAWQTLCGGATEAAARIYKGGTEEESETLTPCIFLDFSSLPTNWIGGRLTGRVTYEIRCEFPIPVDDRQTYEDEYIYAWTQLAGILDGINSGVNGAGKLMIDSLEVSTPPARIARESNKGRTEWGFILAMAVKFI